MENLIDISREDVQVLYAPKGLKFSKAKILDSLMVSEQTPCRLEEIVRHMNSPPTQRWKELRVDGNAYILDDTSTLYRIVEQSVKRNQENDISAEVTFEKNIAAKNMEISGNINNINITNVISDALYSDSPIKQTIKGRKWYTTLEVEEALVKKNSDIAVINDEDIKRLNDDIVTRNRVNNKINGIKTFFGGLQADVFKCNKGIDAENIVTMPASKKIPQAIFDSVRVTNNLNISFINRINFSQILEDRLLLNGAEIQVCNGLYFIDHAKIKDIITSTINNIKIANVVFDDGTVQNITGPKFFRNKVRVLGKLKVESINGYNITKEFGNALRNDGNESLINGSVTVLEPSTVAGNITTESINGFPIASLQEIFSKSNAKDEVEFIDAMKEALSEKIDRLWQIIQYLPKEYMYLEESTDLQISAKNAIRGNAVSNKDYVYIQLEEDESGDRCGLPKKCKCISQKNIIVSPATSITDFIEKDFQRIFTYDDEHMAVHFLTNSVSTSSDCRTDPDRVKNEVSMLTWITTPKNNSTGKFLKYKRHFTGFIKKVKFFTYLDKMYVIIARYYDPIMDTYDLDCTILRFNENRTDADVVQTLPTKGVQELYPFYTAQGIRLIIGNVKEDEEETQIYTFDPTTEKFTLLRTIPYYGCSSATGIVLGVDSLIALRHRYGSVQILKYYPEFDNYYHFQNFDHDEPVIGMSMFYAGGYGISDPYLCLVTQFQNYFIYSYRNIEGWRLVSNGQLERLKNVIPMEMDHRSYIIALSAKSNSLLKIVKNGSS